ncbi:hypothetical protein SATMO3_22850 [Sporomusa aerivorans]
MESPETANKGCALKCQLCEEHPATATIKNKFNGRVLRVCKNCLEYLKLEGNR